MACPIPRVLLSRLGGPAEEVLVKNLSFWRHDPEAAQPGDQLMGDTKKQDCDLVPEARTELSLVIEAGICREEPLACQTSVGKGCKTRFVFLSDYATCLAS